MKTNSIILAAAALAAASLAAGCSTERDAAGVSAPVAVRIRADIGDLQTRTSGSAWTDGDQIGVTVSATAGRTEGRNVPYTKGADGSWTAVDEPIYFQDLETVTFRAYYPYTASENLVDDKIQKTITAEDQSADAQALIDYLYASGATASAKNPTVDFTLDNRFQHRMSQLTLSFQAGTGVADLSGLSSYTLEGLVMEGTFDPFEGTAAAVAAAAAQELTIALTADEGSVSPSSSVLLFPQSPENGRFSIVVNFNGLDYRAELTLPTGAFPAGRNLRYAVTISNIGLNVGTAEIAGWDDKTGDPGAAGIVLPQPLGEITDPAQVVKGDYAMSDGTFVSQSKTLTSKQKAGCAGVVFWTEAESDGSATLSDDKILATDYPSCTHGLIVALEDVEQSEIVRWRTNYLSSVTVFSFQNSDAFNPENKSDYRAIQSGGGEDHSVQYISGYQNTRIMRAFNDWATDPGDIVLLIDYLDSFTVSHPSPENSSGWFIPSAKELSLLCGEDLLLEYASDFSVGTGTIAFINPLIAAAGGTVMPTGNYGWYWSSLEYWQAAHMAWAVNFDSGIVHTVRKDTWASKARVVCAF